MKTKHPITAMLLAYALLIAAEHAGAQDWPQWRGPNRDNKVTGFTEPKTWPKELTNKWKVPVGLGESSPVLVGDKVFVFGRQGGDEVTLCVDAATGKEVWKDSYKAITITNAAKAHPGPRSTPAVGDGKICTLGVGGVVSCLDAATGKVVWRTKDVKGVPQYYTSSSPLIVDGKCIVFVNALIAYDLASGDSKWEWKAEAPYGSPVLMTVEGTKQVVTPAKGLLAGIGLVDGKELWKIKVAGDNMATPVVDGQTVIYSLDPFGTVALKIEKKADGFSAMELWKKSLADTKFYSPVLKDGMLFGVTKGAKLFCMDTKSGEQVWLGKEARGDCGHILNVGSVLVAPI
jgi:outer membrane protein assembly factor BamB